MKTHAQPDAAQAAPAHVEPTGRDNIREPLRGVGRSALTQLQEMANASPRVKHLHELREMANRKQGQSGTRPGQNHSENLAGKQTDEPGVVQRRIRVAATNQVYSTVETATAAAGQDCTPLATPLTSGDTFTVKQLANLTGLAQGNQEQVLRPRKHVIGENHNASQFDRIRGEWPGVAAMGEGRYTVQETGLALPAARSAVHTTFENAMQSQGPGILPLENYHSAAIAQLTGYLVIWNEHQNAASDDTRRHIRERTNEMVNVFNAYANVSAGVVIRAISDQMFGLWRSYKGDIERAYGAIYDKLQESRAAQTCLGQIKAEVDRNRPIPAIGAGDFTAVRTWITNMIQLIGKVLTVSMKGQATAQAVDTEVAAASRYVQQGATTLRGRDMQTALDQINPTRERSMAEHIQTLAKPGLVKVGRAHIGRLTTLAIPDAELYNDAGDFEAALRKRANDL